MKVNDSPTYFVYCTNTKVKNSTLMKIYGDALKMFNNYRDRFSNNKVKIKKRKVDGVAVITAPSNELINKIKSYLNGKYSPIGQELFLIDNNYYRDIKPHENKKVLEMIELEDSNKYYVYCAEIEKLTSKQLFILYKKYFEASKNFKGQMCIRNDRKQVFSTPNLKNAKAVKDWMNQQFEGKLTFKIDNSYYRDDE